MESALDQRFRKSLQFLPAPCLLRDSAPTQAGEQLMESGADGPGIEV